jgi:hypothetical protein
VSWYLNTVGNTTVLTRNEEAQLGAIIHLGSAVKRAQKELRAEDGSEAPLDEVGIPLGPCKRVSSQRSTLYDRLWIRHAQLQVHYTMSADVRVCPIYRLHGIWI